MSVLPGYDIVVAWLFLMFVSYLAGRIGRRYWKEQGCWSPDQGAAYGIVLFLSFFLFGVPLAILVPLFVYELFAPLVF